MPPRTPAASRSLADDLRARDDAQLVALLRARPDLAAPVPADITSLAARATTRASVQRALDGLDTATLRCVEALAALPEPCASADVARLLGLRPAAVAGQLARLRDLALAWGTGSGLLLVRTVRDSLGPHPAGLGPPLVELLDRRDPTHVVALARDLGLSPASPDVVTAVAAHLADPVVLGALIDAAPAQARNALDRLTWGSPVGAVPRADRAVDRDSAASPVEWLLARGLLAVADPGHVVLPREVGLALRGGRLHTDAGTETPAPIAVERAGVDASAGAAAAELLRLVEELLQAWSMAPPLVLRSGGLGVRELRRTATTLDVDESTAAFVVEIAYAAGLVGDDGEVGPSWAPTPASDLWHDDVPAGRWALLARAWRGCTRTPGLVGSRDDRGAVRAALSADVDRPATLTVRAAVLAELADVGPHLALDPASLLERLRWRRPRRTGRLHDDLVAWTLREAELIGVTGRGALSTPGRTLVTAPDAGPPGRRADPAAAAIGPLLPPLVDHVLLQADLTAIAPGPLEPELARAMTLAADVESRGGATVYRFSATSVRRALDAGWSAVELLDLLAARSRTPLPQPLAYLVGDVARRHGQVRVGAAGAYVRSDDEALLAELVADRKAAPLLLRRLAPTVLVAQSDPATVLAVLRQLGLAPAAESADGAVVVRRPDARRTPPRQPPRPTTPGPSAPSDGLLAAIVRSVRAAQDGHDDGPARGPVGPPLVATDPSVTLATLRAAAAGRQRVWIGYVDAAGRAERRLVEPLVLEGGRLTAFDQGSAEVRSFSVHRVTGVVRAEEPA